MKSLAELADLDRRARLGEFSSYVKNLARAGGNFGEAAAMAEASRAPQRTRELLQKAAVTGAGPDSWGSELSGYQTLVSGFQDALRTSSAFYRMLGDGALIRLPFDVRIGSIGTAAGASVVEPGVAIPVSRMDIGAALLPRRKAAALLVLSRELLDAGGSAAEGLIPRSLRASVAQAVDAEFVGIVTAGVTAGSATADVLVDLSTVLTAAALTDGSRPYWIAAPDVAIRLATLETAAAGGRMFPEVNPIGQSALLQIPLLVSGAVDAGELILADASGIGGASETIRVDVSQQAALEMSDTPTQTIGASGGGSPAIPVASTGVSVWQTNSTAIRCTAWFGAARLRATGVAALTGIAW